MTDAEFERKRKEAEALAESKTAKNRAKRQKKKQRSKVKAGTTEESSQADDGTRSKDLPIKKRRLVNGKELVFRRPGEESEDDEEDDAVDSDPNPAQPDVEQSISADAPLPAVVDVPRITIVEDD